MAVEDVTLGDEVTRSKAIRANMDDSARTPAGEDYQVILLGQIIRRRGDWDSLVAEAELVYNPELPVDPPTDDRDPLGLLDIGVMDETDPENPVFVPETAQNKLLLAARFDIDVLVENDARGIGIYEAQSTPVEATDYFKKAEDAQAEKGRQAANRVYSQVPPNGQANGVTVSGIRSNRRAAPQGRN